MLVTNLSTHQRTIIIKVHTVQVHRWQVLQYPRQVRKLMIFKGEVSQWHTYKCKMNY